jgi:hypothetical protein
MEHLPEPPPGRPLVRIRTRTRPSITGFTDLARQIETEHQAVIGTAQTVLIHALRCGQLLLEVRQQLPQGTWLAWLAKTTITPRTAQRYMRIYQHREQLSEDATRVSHLSVRAAVAMTSTPRETPAEASAINPSVPARAPAGAPAPATRGPTRPPLPVPETDHLARLQAVLATFRTLPEPDVLAHAVGRRQVDSMLRELTNASQYITSFARELNARCR